MDNLVLIELVGCKFFIFDALRIFIDSKQIVFMESLGHYFIFWLKLPYFYGEFDPGSE